MPPALMAALWTGPVTMPSQARPRQASAAASRASMVARAVAGCGRVGVAGAASGCGGRANVPPGAASRSGAGRARGRSSARAAASRTSPSPKTWSSASRGAWSARTHSSGPTPAGSPGTSASRGRRISAAAGGAGRSPDVDVGLAAHLAQEAVPLVFQLALADGLARLVAAVLVVDRGLAAARALHDVPAGLGAEGRGNLAVGERGDLVAELGAEVVLGEPPEVAAVLAAHGVLGGLAGDRREVGAPGDARAHLLDPLPGGVVVAADQDVARLVLRDHLPAARGGVAHVDQLQQLEAAGAARGAEHLARLHGADHGRERARDLVERAPAQVAAFQCIGGVGVADGGGAEVHLAALEQRGDAVDLLLGKRDLLRGGAAGQGHQDVRQPVLLAAALGRQRGVDLGLGDRDHALREALAQALDRELVAQRTAELAEGDAVGGELLAQLVRGHVVLPRDGGDGGVELLLGHADAGGAGAGGLELDQDQALEHLAAQHRLGRQLVEAVAVLDLDVAHRALELALQDHVLVDHRGDAVDRLDLLGGDGREGGRQGEGKGKEEVLHGDTSDGGGSPSSLRTSGGGTRYRSSRW